MPSSYFNRRKYLLLDSRLLNTTENVALRVGTVQKHPKNPLFGEDRPWEVRYDNLYPNAIFDAEEQTFKCWYNPFIIDRGTSETSPAQRASIPYTKIPNQRREMGLCYATSQDGITWQKPNLGLIEHAGDKNNNLLARAAHGPGVFKDLHETDPAKRYKMLFASDVPAARHGVSVRFSADGIHWGDPIKVENRNAARGDSHHTWLWAPELNRYVSCSRPMGWGERRAGNVDVPLRPISRTDSEDFIHWSDAQIVLDPSDPQRQYYVMPIFHYADVYLGFLMIFNAITDRVHCELTWSPDTWQWNHIDACTPLIDTSDQKGDYDWGCVYASVPIFLPDTIRIYYGASDETHYGWRRGYLALATLRPDGFAGLQPATPNLPATVMTQPIVCTDSRLRLSADASGGIIRVEILDPEGKTLEESQPITGNVTDAELSWSSGNDLSAYQDKAIQLRFKLTHAKLYAFSFADATVQ
jgi:hypothetical protein